ncbi:hypothetical protein ES703_122460 [subsurface metagenome]
MTSLHCRNNILKELGIEDEQGNVDLVKLKEHVETCPKCKQYLFLLGDDFIDNLIAGFGRFWKVKQG